MTWRMHELALAKSGFTQVPDVLRSHECENIAACAVPSSAPSGGTRSLLLQDCCKSLVTRLRNHPDLSILIPLEFAAVQCTYFEKSASRNWLVPLHQDLSIPVAKPVKHPSLRGWSQKEGRFFVQAPVELLEQLVAVRLHLDPCGPQDGPLRVLPGTHLRGRIESPAARKAIAEVACNAERGSALVMRPLLLHASSKSSGLSRRRVLHFLFGPRHLPHGLEWPHVV